MLVNWIAFWVVVCWLIGFPEDGTGNYFLAAQIEADLLKTVCCFTGGLIYKSNASNMQSVTSISFLALAYAKYLSDVSKVARCGNVEATPARLRSFAKRQVGSIRVNLYC